MAAYGGASQDVLPEMGSTGVIGAGPHSTINGTVMQSDSRTIDEALRQVDAGLVTLRLIYQRLLIDEEWSVRGPRHFSWVGHRLPQWVAAGPMSESRGQNVSRISVRTTVVAGITRPEEEVLGYLAARNADAVGSAYVFLPEKAEVHAVLAHTVHDETVRLREEQIASYAILQLCQAEMDADGLAAVLGGEVPRAQHPSSGPRNVADAMLAVAERLYRPAGTSSSRFAVAAEMVAVADLCTGTGLASLGGDFDGVCVEVPFGEGGTTLVHLETTQKHAWLGTGLHIATWLPLLGDETTHSRRVHALQGAQMQTFLGGGQLGAWSRRTRNGTPHTVWNRFIPNHSFRPQLALDAAMGEINRALWVDELLFPDLPRRDAWRVLVQRETTRQTFGLDASSGQTYH
jgi:hypothetical protein